MGIKHINKILTLPVPSREKFVLVVLGRYASNDDDTCFPGITKLSEITGFCEKTVQRALKVLNRLGIIDIKTGKRGNNIYTLFLTGDLESWNEYLYSKLIDLGYSTKDLESLFKDSKSCYKELNNNKIGKEFDKEVGFAGNHLAAVDNATNSDEIDSILYAMPPGKRQSALEKIWVDTVSTYYDGKVVKITNCHKWELEDVYNRCKEELPVYDFVKHTIINWSTFVKKVKAYNSHLKQVAHFPDINFFGCHSHEAVVAYIEHLYD